MNALVNALAKIIEAIKKDEHFSNIIQFDRVEYSSEEEKMKAFFKTVKHLSPFEFMHIKQKLEISGNEKIKILLDQSDYAEAILSD